MMSRVWPPEPLKTVPLNRSPVNPDHAKDARTTLMAGKEIQKVYKAEFVQLNLSQTARGHEVRQANNNNFADGVERSNKGEIL